MKNLIKFEYRKLFRGKALYIMISVMMALIILSMLMELLINSFFSIDSYEISALEMTAENAVNASGIYDLVTILVPIIICCDFKNGTLKNIVSKGYSRIKIFSAKYISAITSAIILFGVAITACYIGYSLLFNLNTAISSKQILLILSQLLYIITSATMSFTISVLVKSRGGSIALSILSPTIISLLLTVIEALLNKIDGYVFKIVDYWFTNLPLGSDDLGKSSLIYVIYLAFFIAVSFFATKKIEA